MSAGNCLRVYFGDLLLRQGEKLALPLPQGAKTPEISHWWAPAPAGSGKAGRAKKAAAAFPDGPLDTGHSRPGQWLDAVRGRQGPGEPKPKAAALPAQRSRRTAVVFTYGDGVATPVFISGNAERGAEPAQLLPLDEAKLELAGREKRGLAVALIAHDAPITPKQTVKDMLGEVKGEVVGLAIGSL